MKVKGCFSIFFMQKLHGCQRFLIFHKVKTAVNHQSILKPRLNKRSLKK